MELKNLNYSYAVEQSRFKNINYGFVIVSPDQKEAKKMNELFNPKRVGRTSYLLLQDIIYSVFPKDKLEKNDGGRSSFYADSISRSYIIIPDELDAVTKDPFQEALESIRFELKLSLSITKDVLTKLPKVEVDLYHIDFDNARILSLYDEILETPQLTFSSLASECMKKIEMLRVTKPSVGEFFDLM